MTDKRRKKLLKIKYLDLRLKSALLVRRASVCAYSCMIR